jgi:hypothetical protein
MAGDGKLTTSGARLIDLETACQDRLSDAESLFNSGRHAAAIAAGLYALEIGLKVKICKRLALKELPRAFEIHDLDGLLVLTGLSRLLNGPAMKRSKVKRNWDEIRTASGQLNDLRYLPADRWDAAQAKRFLYQLKDEDDGALTWLLKQP